MRANPVTYTQPQPKGGSGGGKTSTQPTKEVRALVALSSLPASANEPSYFPKFHQDFITATVTGSVVHNIVMEKIEGVSLQ